MFNSSGGEGGRDIYSTPLRWLLTNNMGEQRLGGDQGFFWGGSSIEGGGS